MEVKDVQKLVHNPGQSTQEAAPGLQRALIALSGSKVPQETFDRVEVKSSVRSRSDATTMRRDANDVIAEVNNASDSVRELEKLVRSIDGIVKQVDKGNLSEKRVAALEKEANQLVERIKELANSNPPPAAPESEQVDEKREKIERTLRRALDTIMPEEAKDGFGLGTITFSKKDSIVATVSAVAAARVRIEGAQETVQKTREAVGEVVTTYEVAIQNAEASEASVRDVDQAVKLASETRSSIFKNPENAIDSAGTLTPRALELLKT